MTVHFPVMGREICESLPMGESLVIVDGTFGFGGHFKLIQEALGKRLKKYIGIEQDPFLFSRMRQEFRRTPHLTLVQGNFRNIDQLLPSGLTPDVFLLDLGMNTEQLTSGERGFSFREDGPLDMRLNPVTQHVTALDVIRDFSEQELVDAFKVCSSVRSVRALVRRMKEFVALKDVPKTTKTLISAIRSLLPREKRIHPATTVFQTLRILVNDELGALEEGLFKMMPKGPSRRRIMVLSFHSVEHRVVKQFFLKHGDVGKMKTRKPICPSELELKQNPSSRSAQLRVFECYEKKP